MSPFYFGHDVFCLWKGEGWGARGGQSITNRGQVWIDIPTTITKKGISK
jgi:hypothetical protein